MYINDSTRLSLVEHQMALEATPNYSTYSTHPDIRINLKESVVFGSLTDNLARFDYLWHVPRARTRATLPGYGIRKLGPVAIP